MWKQESEQERPQTVGLGETQRAQNVSAADLQAADICIALKQTFAHCAHYLPPLGWYFNGKLRLPRSDASFGGVWADVGGRKRCVSKSRPQIPIRLHYTPKAYLARLQFSHSLLLSQTPRAFCQKLTDIASP